MAAPCSCVLQQAFENNLFWNKIWPVTTLLPYFMRKYLDRQFINELSKWWLMSPFPPFPSTVSKLRQTILPLTQLLLSYTTRAFDIHINRDQNVNLSQSQLLGNTIHTNTQLLSAPFSVLLILKTKNLLQFHFALVCSN